MGYNFKIHSFKHSFSCILNFKFSKVQERLHIRKNKLMNTFKPDYQFISRGLGSVIRSNYNVRFMAISRLFIEINYNPTYFPNFIKIKQWLQVKNLFSAFNFKL